MDFLLKRPSAWIPIAMSLVCIAMFIGIVTVYGVQQQPQQDEGTAAHLFQLLMGLQFPLIAFFAIKWLPQAPRQALTVLSLQLLAGVTACAPVYILHL